MSLLPLLSLSLLLLATQTYSSSPNCESFMCGSLNISYPFSIYNQSTSEHCGVPGFLISCENNTAILHLQQEDYTVMSINYDNNTITLVDTDVLINATDCPKVQNNVSFFNDSGVSYTSSDTNLVFFFDCSLFNGMNLTHISCFVPENGDSYVFDSNYLDSNPSLYTDLKTYCAVVVVAPVLEYYVNQYYTNLNTAFVDVLQRGFELGWNSTNDCTECQINNHGQCGYTLLPDNKTYTFKCFCSNGSCGTYTFKCHMHDLQ